MSDEEKKAIESLIEIREFANLSSYKDTKINQLNAIDTILNLIEKQSKEIEELKNADLTTVYLNGVYNGEKKVKDKLKAKIEVLDKEEKEKLKGTKGQDRYAIKQEYMHKRSALQSLLEKE